MLPGALLDRATHPVIDLSDIRNARVLSLEFVPPFLDVPVER